MTTERFWVLGGEYSCPAFRTLKTGAEVIGPFETREEARLAWKAASSRSPSALAKYSITAEQIALPQ